MWVIGDGTMLEQLKKINIDGVTFYGHVENTLKYDLLKRAHLVLMPSVREGWGLVVTEANAMGTPVIAYNVPGLRDSVMDEKTGILLNENSPQKLAEAAIYLLTDMNALKKYSVTALDFSKNFSWDNTSIAFDKIIKQLA